MQIGINQDVVFKGERFHIQTEDSGVKRPVITTTLFKGGVIVASRKLDYKDRLGSKTLEEDVTGLMQGQHKDVIRALKGGEFEKGKKASPSKEKPQAGAKEPVAAKPVSKPQPVQKAKTGRPLKVTKKALEEKVLEFLSLKQ